jgi:hypothetical protein
MLQFLSLEDVALRQFTSKKLADVHFGKGPHYLKQMPARVAEIGMAQFEKP